MICTLLQVKFEGGLSVSILRKRAAFKKKVEAKTVEKKKTKFSTLVLLQKSKIMQTIPCMFY
jgi:hypothetical protein